MPEGRETVVAYKFIKLLKHSGDCPTMLVVDGDGVRYVQKLLDNTQLDIYRKLSKLNIRGIPKINIAKLDDMVLPEFMEPLRDELTDNSAALLIEEYIDGSDLEKLMKDGHKFKRSEFRKMTFSLCRTLRQVHKAGIVHRDIKPANIIRSKDGNCYVIDFGIAREPAQSNTQTKIVATLGYASPEQLVGKRATPESDIYALGRLMKEIYPKGRAYRTIYSKATMDDPKKRYRTVRRLSNAIRLIPFMKFVKGLIATILALFIFIMVYPFDDDTPVKQESYGASLSSEELAAEEQRLLAEIEKGNDGIGNYIKLSGIYENQGDMNKAADILIEYVDTVDDRRLYLSASPVYKRLEAIKPYTTVDKQAEILELNGNADYIDRLIEAGEYEHAKEVLADIEANPCRAITRESTRNDYYVIPDYYSQIYEKQGDYEKAVDEIIIAGGYLNIKKFSKDTLYYNRLHDLRKKVSKDTQKKIDEICE